MQGSGSHDSPTHPDIWTQRMLKACKDAGDAKKYRTPRDRNKKMFALDDLEEATDPDMKLSSPRSLQACLHLGIDPSEVVFRPPDAYTERGLMKELQQLKFEHHEVQRKEKLRRLKEERSCIIKKEMEDKLAAKRAAYAAGHKKYMGDNDLLDKDRNRLEVLRRRQQRELEQMAKYEAQRQKMSKDNRARVEAERKLEEKKRQEKIRKEKEWQQELRHRELQKLKEEEELDKKSKQMAAERYLREQQLMQAEQEQSVNMLTSPSSFLVLLLLTAFQSMIGSFFYDNTYIIIIL
ncbi:hypothetical protein O6H91_22G036100 [Diphasiastrum complanatum]|uniref:Uncharacterized protein n=1 Tax=Diphasiastrum complanatum TaxID=34168 RepID=A0ACC2AEG0_DIPCM|nr:hypothetical protein O6H91_22G036100 [Diphasiastrum complanatum]